MTKCILSFLFYPGFDALCFTGAALLSNYRNYVITVITAASNVKTDNIDTGDGAVTGQYDKKQSGSGYSTEQTDTQFIWQPIH